MHGNGRVRGGPHGRRAQYCPNRAEPIRCRFCERSLKTWSVHAKNHGSEPVFVLQQICGDLCRQAQCMGDGAATGANSSERGSTSQATTERRSPSLAAGAAQAWQFRPAPARQKRKERKKNLEEEQTRLPRWQHQPGKTAAAALAQPVQPQPCSVQG